MLKYAILAILRHKAMTGYELEQFINKTIAHFWTAKLSQIYRTLKRLEEEEFVRSHVEVQEGKPDKRIYELTKLGEENLEEWQATLVTEIDDIRQPSLMRFFFFGRKDPDDVLMQLKVWKGLHEARAQYFENELPNIIKEAKKDIEYTDLDAFFWEQTKKLGHQTELAKAKWLEEVIDDYNKFTKQQNQ